MFKKIAISLTLAASFLISVPTYAQTADQYQQSGINMMSGMMGTQFDSYQSAWRQQYGDSFVNNMYQAMGQYAQNNPEVTYRFSKMMSNRYGMMGSWTGTNFGTIHFFGFIFCLIWIVNSILIGYLLVVLIQKFAHKK